jgi:hypothetical protein
MKTRILARCYLDGSWMAVAYQGEAAFCTVRTTSASGAVDELKKEVQTAVTLQARAWLDQHKEAGSDILNCPEGAIELSVDLWVCKLTKDQCPIQAQVFLKDRNSFLQGCLAPQDRKEQIFDSAVRGTYDGFHHVTGRFLCVSCERRQEDELQYHYPWELTHLDAYKSFDFERDWLEIRARLKDKHFGLTLVSTALCPTHCCELAQQIDPALAAEMMVIDFELFR